MLQSMFIVSMFCASCAIISVGSVLDAGQVTDWDRQYLAGVQLTKVMRLYSQAEINMFLQSENQDTAVMGYFPLPAFQAELAIFREVADVLEQKYRFAFTTEDKIMTEMGLNKFAIFIHKPEREIYSKHDSVTSVYPGNQLNNTFLSWFIETAGLPLVGVKTEDNRERYEETPIPEFTVITEVDLEKNKVLLRYYVDQLLDIALRNFGKMVFNIVEERKVSDIFWQSLQVDAQEGVVFIRQNDIFFIPTDDFEFSVDAVNAFIDDVRSGNIPGKLLRPPESNKASAVFDSAVLMLTNKNFNAIVHHDVTVDIVIVFFAPWCGLCKSLKPEYEAVAKMFSKDVGVIVAAMDATINTVPLEYKVKGYPTIVLCPAAIEGALRPDPIIYDGVRSADAISVFIRSRSVNLQKKNSKRFGVESSEIIKMKQRI